jgi:hypothetical protein
MKTVITTDATKISRLAGLFPGIIFDLRSMRKGCLIRVRFGKYVSLLTEENASFLCDVLGIVRRKRYPLYVIGDEEKWQEILRWADVPEPGTGDKTIGDLEEGAEQTRVGEDGVQEQ